MGLSNLDLSIPHLSHYWWRLRCAQQAIFQSLQFKISAKEHLPITPKGVYFAKGMVLGLALMWPMVWIQIKILSPITNGPGLDKLQPSSTNPGHKPRQGELLPHTHVRSLRPYPNDSLHPKFVTCIEKEKGVYHLPICYMYRGRKGCLSSSNLTYFPDI